MNEKQLRVVGLLKSGLTPKEVAAETGINYQTVLGWKKKFEASDEEAVVSDLAMHKVQTLLEVKQELRDSAPEIAAEAEKLIDNIIGLKELEPAFHTVMMRAIHRADVFMQDPTISIKEWQLVIKSISEAYAAIFNKSGTVVNVANTNVSAGQESLNFFKASKGA